MTTRNLIENIPLYLTWFILLSGFILSTIGRDWKLAALAGITFIFTLFPFLLQKKFDIYISKFFTSVISVFIFASIYLGEANQFYDKIWWWDLFLHLISAIIFGLAGVIMLLIVFGKQRNKSNPQMFAIFSFCFAVSIGVVWEIFEFSMDQTFGLNMQKSGLMDTMSDLIIDCIGAGIASISGYLYLTDSKFNFFSDIIERNYIGNKALSKRERSNDSE